MTQSKMPAETEWMFNPRDFGAFLWRNKILIAVAFILGGLGGYGYSLLLPDSYKVSATILPQQAQESRLSGALSALGGLAGNIGGGGDASSRVYPVIFKSRKILEPALLERYEGKTYQDIFIEQFRPNKFPKEKIIGIVQKKVLDVSVDRTSGVTTLTVIYRDPKVAAAFANALLRKMDHFFNFQYQTAASLQKKMTETRLESVGDSLRICENRLAEFLTRNRSYEQSPNLAIGEMRLRRELEVQSTLYKELLRQRETVKFNELSMNPVLNVLDEAAPAIEKFAPIRRKIALAAGLASMIFAMVVLKLISMLRVRSPGEK